MPGESEGAALTTHAASELRRITLARARQDASERGPGNRRKSVHGSAETGEGFDPSRFLLGEEAPESSVSPPKSSPSRPDGSSPTTRGTRLSQAVRARGGGVARADSGMIGSRQSPTRADSGLSGLTGAAKARSPQNERRSFAPTPPPREEAKSPPKNSRRSLRTSRDGVEAPEAEREVATLQSFNRRKDESSYYAAETNAAFFRADAARLRTNGKLREALGLRPPQKPRADLLASAGLVRRGSRGGARRGSSGGTTPRVSCPPPDDACLEVDDDGDRLEAVVGKHHAKLLRVHRHFCAAFSDAPRNSPTSLRRGGWRELLASLDAVDRRRLGACAAAADKAFDACSKNAAPDARGVDGLVATDGERPALDGAGFVAALGLFLANSTGSNLDELDAALGDALNFLLEARPRACCDPDVFRRFAVYTAPVDALCRSHARALNALFTRERGAETRFDFRGVGSRAPPSSSPRFVATRPVSADASDIVAAAPPRPFLREKTSAE